ncbi:hypothetical protein JW921_02935 [Candidatus Fermentibacterales bacterium]|nr:hypothetical protein [Candidatus Fermentibacterales bacterium]
MTGLSVYGSYIYVSSVSQKCCYRYTAPSITGRYAYTTYGGLAGTRDIAMDGSTGWVWVACNSTSYPIRAYKSGICQFILDTTVVPYAYGLTIDPDGYLWVSDEQNDVIYQVDPYATSLTPATWGRIKASF